MTERDRRIIGSRPTPPPKDPDPETERVREALRNPFARHYGKDKGGQT